MKRMFFHFVCISIGAGCLTALFNPFAVAAERCDPWVAKVTSAQGRVEAKRAGETRWQPVRLNDTYCPGDQIRVQERSRADLALVNQPVLRLDQNTAITLGGVKKERTSLVELLKGAAHFFSRAPRSLEVRTAFVNAGVEGTEFFIRVDRDKTFLSIFEGKVLASNEAGSLALTGGQSAVAEAGKAPVLRVVVHPRDAVQWALYYPPVLYVPSGEAPPKEDTNDTRYLTHRASFLLSVGRADEASADIKKALRLDPNYSDAYALQSVVAVVQNNKEQAIVLAKKAVETGPKSATARIALSYARQAGFDLEGARESLREAVRLDPNNGLAWARLAEMWSSFGELDKGLEAARKAVVLNPDLSRTQTVLGFAYLTQVKTTAAKKSFEKAIALDQADPLPRLGMGLAMIREGDLKRGGREIEIAASLDPNNSLIRSYLGKVYFEEKRIGYDAQEYGVARELDPRDPTPWFYDAIAKQTTNRPVEALQDLQKAIELNDNRAVYRSKLLLDSDLAARSASLARIYGDLGFQQRALVEGWNSVNTDPTNFSAHRFLADSYAILPRHEIARVSELLQSQLLQPMNTTPIQPRLAESSQFLISSGGATTLSFNEFNPLFNRTQTRLQANGLVGGNETRGGEAVISGVYKRASYSAGGSAFKTDGWRQNADQDDDIANIFAQMELSHKTSVQAEYRYRDTERGDLLLRFFEGTGDFRPNERQKEKTDSVRLGFRHAFSPGSILIGNFMRQDVDASLKDEPLLPFINALDVQTGERAVTGELQYLFRSQWLNILGGTGYFKIDAKDDSTTSVIFPPFTIQETVDRDTRHGNFYVYSHIKVPQTVTWTIGTSLDLLDTNGSGAKDKDQFNPKFGVTWRPFAATTFRAAAFRSLKRTLVTDQTLEPTQVAGFNQFFDDATATDAWRYGAGVDQKVSKNLYGGLEVSKRDLDVPFLDPLANTVDTADWNESLCRAYLYWTPHEWLALRVEYQYETLEREEKFTFDGVKDLHTRRVVLGGHFFHPTGLSGSIRATYYDQDGHIMPDTSPTFLSAQDDFWIVNASISYRLPKRYGFITLGANNLFDRDFKYQETDFDNPEIQPDRLVFCKITIAFP